MHLLARAWVLAALLGALGAQAQIVYRDVTTTGNGGDPGEALLDALETAIAQVTGQRLSSSVSLTISESTRNGSTQMTEDFRQKVEKATETLEDAGPLQVIGTAAGSIF